MSVTPPNYTQVPNEVLALMPVMDETELRVVLAVCRKTFGWQKARDRISISQIEGDTGLSRQGAIEGTRKALERGILLRYPKGQQFEYEIHCTELVNSVDQLNVLGNTASQSSGLAQVNSVDQLNPKLVNSVDTQKKTEKKKIKKEEFPAAIAASPNFDNSILVAVGTVEAVKPTTPSKVSTSKTKQTKAATQPLKTSPLYGDLFAGVARLTQFDTSAPGIAGRVGRTAKFLDAKVAAGLTLDQVDLFGEWWRKFDWRGKQNQPPTPEQVCEAWGRFFEWQKTGSPTPQPTQNRAQQNQSEPKGFSGIREWIEKEGLLNDE